MNDILEHLYYVTGFCAAVLLDQFEVGSIFASAHRTRKP